MDRLYHHEHNAPTREQERRAATAEERLDRLEGSRKHREGWCDGLYRCGQCNFNYRKRKGAKGA